MKTILVYSGGLDSTTLLYKLLADGDTVHALSFNYGQRHKKELKAAAKICHAYRQASKNLQKTGANLSHKIIDVTAVKNLLSGSALTDNVVVPEGHYKAKTMRATVVPNRNMIFISLAAAAAVSMKFDRIALAVHAGDHAIYPDCRPGFIRAAEKTLRAGNYEKIKIYAPFLRITKSEIAKIGKRLGVPFSETWTCYKGQSKPCGKCGACVERAEALTNI